MFVLLRGKGSRFFDGIRIQRDGRMQFYGLSWSVRVASDVGASPFLCANTDSVWTPLDGGSSSSCSSISATSFNIGLSPVSTARLV